MVRRDRRWRLRKIAVALVRWNEYTSWRPRLDRGDHFGMMVVGPVVVSWEMERIRTRGDLHAFDRAV